MKGLLIFGGAGFLGTNIALMAVKRGYSVVVFDSFVRSGSENNIKTLIDAGVEIIRGDIRNKQDFNLIDKMPDVIINLAAQVGISLSLQYPLMDYEINATGTLNILEFAREMGNVPVIYASTNKVFADVNKERIIEKDSRYEFKDIVGINEKNSLIGGQHTPYGLSKLVGALYCKEYFHTYKLPVVINHMSCLYGFHQSGNSSQGWIDFIMKCIMRDGKVNVYGDGKQIRDLLWCEDIAELYLAQVEKVNEIAGEEFAVGGGQRNTMSLLEAITYGEEISGIKAEITFGEWRAADQKVFYADISKAKELLGWEPKVSPRQGIKRMYENYK